MGRYRREDTGGMCAGHGPEVTASPPHKWQRQCYSSVLLSTAQYHTNLENVKLPICLGKVGTSTLKK